MIDGNVVDVVIAFVVGAMTGAAIIDQIRLATIRQLAIRHAELKSYGDEWKAMAKERQVTIDKMRLDGYQVQKSAVVKEAPDIELEGLARAEAQATMRRTQKVFVDRMASDLMRKNPRLSEAEARREAIRMREELDMEDPPT